MKRKFSAQRTFPSDIILVNIDYQAGECSIYFVNGWHHK